MADSDILVGLLRHGETSWNVSKKIQGRTETDLSPSGEMQARAWGRALDSRAWDHILCSPMSRAVRTANLVNESLGLTVTIDERLVEQDWGEWTGRTVAELRRETRGEVERQEARGWRFHPPGGEDRLNLLYRGRAALQDCLQAHPGKNILVVTHLGLIKCLVCDILGLSFMPGEPSPVKKRRMQILKWTGQRFDVQRLNVKLKTEETTRQFRPEDSCRS
jgi:probable phosphoglycerate mutase